MSTAAPVQSITGDPANVSTAQPTTTTAPPPEATTTTTPLPSQTFASRGGVVTVTCQGQTIQFTANPNNGYQMRVDDSGPNEIRVEFSASENSSLVYATCASGKPSGGVYNDD